MSGLGGWLIAIQISLYATIVAYVIHLFTYIIPSLLLGNEMAVMTSRNSVFYHPLWKPALALDAVFTVLMLVFFAYILIHFYQKKSTLPRLMIIYYCVGVVFALINLTLVNLIPEVSATDGGASLRDVFRKLISCAIWIPYFIKSERVQNTFIR